MARSFVHLHCHTHYSLLDGASRIPELVQHVKGLGMNAVAITDHGNLYGAIEFYTECKAKGLNPIVGYEAYVAPNGRRDREPRRAAAESDDALYHHLTLLAKNGIGFKNLVKLASLAFLEGYHYKPRIDKELLEAHSEGLICLSGCAAAEFSDYILRDKLAEAKRVAEWFHRLFKNDFYIEIQNNGLEIQRHCAQGAVDIANALGLPLVATSDAHYLRREDAIAHDVLLCINTGKSMSNPKRFKFEGDQFHVRGPEEMYVLFPGQAEAVQRSQEIADGVSIELDFKRRHFPVFAPPPGKTPDRHLRELAEAGMYERYGADPAPQVRSRLEHELNTICRMGFAGYFLIVWDFVRFARERGIPCGARGSGCGAVVSYVLSISHVDPMEYDLLFERFLDPNRGEAPDIDIDFCQERREEVIAYVKQKYGEESVAQIATFNTLAAKAALKDVGRVMDLPLDRVNALTKLVPAWLGATLDDALSESSDFKREYDADPDVRRWVDIARTLEGSNRNAGTHAAGVVIANGPILDYVPVHRVVRKDSGAGRGGDPVVTTQWVMGDIEKVGLLKMDFLGLRTLTLLDNAIALIQKTRGETLDVHKLPLDDAPTYQLLSKGDAKGVFQFESDGIRELLKRLKPDNIRDIIACTALYRPGPLESGMVDDYIECKHGRKKPVYPHPIMEEITSETHSVLVFQEQIMRVLNRMGNIELASAYACIKAISKKKQEIIDARKADFIQGAKGNGLTKEKAEEIFELIEKFGRYGFNKVHSAAYAVVSYQTAYLKRHYTAEFMAALLSSEIDDGNKRDMLVDHIADARKFGVDVLPPDVNVGEPDFTVSQGKIVFGLTAIKGLGRGAAEEILRARTEKGPFRDLFDFCERVDGRIVTKAAVERMIKAGAFDGFGRRAALMHVLARAVQAADERQQDRKRGQLSFFDVMEDAADAAVAVAEPLPDVPEWPETERLKHEKEALDFYISSHPLAQVDDELRRFITHTIEQTLKMDEGAEVRIGGMLTQVRFMTTKQSRRFVRCKIEDFTGQAECVMWPDNYERYKEEFADDRILLANVTIEKGQRDEPIYVLQKVLTLDQAKRDLTTAVLLRLQLEKHQSEQIDGIARILKRATGSVRVDVQVTDGMGRKARLRLGDEFKVDPAKLPVEELELILGPGGVVYTGR